VIGRRCVSNDVFTIALRFGTFKQQRQRCC
jgi:hypothetical protein